MEADIVIPVLNAGVFLKECVSNLKKVTRRKYNLIIADDGSTEPDLLKYEDTLDATVLRNKTRLGFGANCNQAAAQGSAPVIVFLNSDTRPCAGWLTALLKELSRESTGVAGSRLLYPVARKGCEAGSIQHAGVARNNQGLPYHIFRGFRADHPLVMRRLEINAVTGACLAVRRDVFEALKGFDPIYAFGQFEDIDLCWRVRKSGLRVVYRPDSLLYHYEHGSGEQYVNATAEANREKLIQRWGNLSSDEHLFAMPKEPAPAPVPPPKAPPPRRLEVEVLTRLAEALQVFGEMKGVPEPMVLEFKRAIVTAQRVVKRVCS